MKAEIVIVEHRSTTLYFVADTDRADPFGEMNDHLRKYYNGVPILKHFDPTDPNQVPGRHTLLAAFVVECLKLPNTKSDRLDSYFTGTIKPHELENWLINQDLAIWYLFRIVYYRIAHPSIIFSMRMGRTDEVIVEQLHHEIYIIGSICTQFKPLLERSFKRLNALLTAWNPGP